jgi:lysophospholipase L1-like esterase
VRLLEFAVSALTVTMSATLLAAAPHPAPSATDHWVGTWGTSPMATKKSVDHFGAPGTDGTTLRETVHISLGGNTVRVILTNEFGIEPLTIGDAQIALPAPDGGIVAGSSIQLSFSGHTSITIPPGALAVSDPATIKLAPLSDVAVSIFLPDQPVAVISYHGSAFTTNYMTAGNTTTATTLTDAKPFYNWQFLKDIDVKADAASAAVVTLGDSITDGAHSARDKNARWPDELARRLAADKRTAGIGVINQGIGGNRVLHDNTGPSALARFDRDVLAQSSVKYLVILEAINDIGHAYTPKNPNEIVTADDLIAGYAQMIERAHTHGIKVYGATLTPYVTAGYSSPKGEEVRQTVNNWIRTSGKFDGVIDFDKTITDPKNPGVFLPDYDSGDHLHPSDAGYKAMGDSIDLSLFTK